MTIKVTKGDSDGTSLGQSITDKAGFHGFSTVQDDINAPNGTNAALTSLLAALASKGIVISHSHA